MYCFDTDVLSGALKRAPPLFLVRRLARVPPEQQFTTAVNLGELLYGAAKRGSPSLLERIGTIVPQAQRVLPFDESRRGGLRTAAGAARGRGSSSLGA